eukprot:10002114-Alexandrium_andersonii.AAC.1
MPSRAHLHGRVGAGRDAEPVNARGAGPVLRTPGRAGRAGGNEAPRKQPLLDPESNLGLAVAPGARQVGVEVARHEQRSIPGRDGLESGRSRRTAAARQVHRRQGDPVVLRVRKQGRRNQARRITVLL